MEHLESDGSINIIMSNNNSWSLLNTHHGLSTNHKVSHLILKVTLKYN